MPLVRQIVTALIRRPWYTASIVTVMAVGCALLTTVLAMVDGVLFKPLGYPDERQLVAVQLASSAARPAGARQSVSPDDLAAWAAAMPEVAFTGIRVQAYVGRVQPNFFDVIGVRPALGGFAPEDFSAASSSIEPRLATHAVFEAEFNADPNALGRVVITDPSTGAGFRLVGVMPRGFRFPVDRAIVNYLAPFVENRGSPYALQAIARLTTTSVSPGEVEARVLAMAAATNPARPGSNSGNHPIDQVTVEPLGRVLGAASRPLFAALLIAAALLVAIAALNASSLMAARSVDRRRELAVRRSLGATGGDIARLLLIEAFVLVAAGVALGLAAAAPLLRFATGLLPDNLELFRDASIDWRVAGFSAATAVLVAAVVAIWPLRLASREDTTPGSNRGVTGEARSLSWRLVVSLQVGLALVLTVGGSLLVWSLLSVYAQTPPIATDNVLTVAVRFFGMPGSVARMAPERATRVEALLERVRAVPGVEAAALTAYDLLEHAYEPARFEVPATAERSLAMVTHAVTAEFYRVLEPHLVSGRLPTAQELATNAPVVVVSERVADVYWPNESAIGRPLTHRGRSSDTRLAFTVIGVVREVPWAAWDEEATPTVYGPYALLAIQTNSAILVRTSADVSQLAREITRVMGEADPLLQVTRVSTLDHLFVDSVRPRRFRAWLFGSFAFASLCVVGLGIFGQLAMSTARRTREVGIRMACGATRGGVARLILREQLVPVIAGLVAGGIAATWAAQFLGAYLYQVTSSDPRVWFAAVGLIVATAAAGTLVPALRASRVDPTEALRAE